MAELYELSQILPGHASIEDGRAFLRARLKKGADCPACGQNAKLYRRSVTSSMALSMILMRRATEPGEFICIKFIDKSLGYASSVYTDLAKGRYWGLVERKVAENGESEKGAFWRLTPRGRDFANGEEKLRHKYAKVYCGTHYGFNGKVFGVKDALRNRFDFGELMSASVDQVESRWSGGSQGEVEKVEGTNPGAEPAEPRDLNEVMAGDRSLEEARVHIRDTLRQKGDCPCCGQNAQTHRRSVNSSMAVAMIAVCRMTEPGGEFVNIKKLVGKHYGLEQKFYTDFAKLRYWNLFVRRDALGGEGGSKNPFWRPTPSGQAFVDGHLRVGQKTAVVYNGQVVSREGSPHGIISALGGRYSYEELMEGDLSAEAKRGQKRKDGALWDEEGNPEEVFFEGKTVPSSAYDDQSLIEGLGPKGGAKKDDSDDSGETEGGEAKAGKTEDGKAKPEVKEAAGQAAAEKASRGPKDRPAKEALGAEGSKQGRGDGAPPSGEGGSGAKEPVIAEEPKSVDENGQIGLW